MTPKQLLEEADALRESLIASRRYLHTHAETGFDLTDTLAYVKKNMADMGYEPALCGKSGLVACRRQKKGPVFLIRGDMDALPIREQAEIDFPSTNGCMHACGMTFILPWCLAPPGCSNSMKTKFREPSNLCSSLQRKSLKAPGI